MIAWERLRTKGSKAGHQPVRVEQIWSTFLVKPLTGRTAYSLAEQRSKLAFLPGFYSQILAISLKKIDVHLFTIIAQPTISRHRPRHFRYLYPRLQNINYQASRKRTHTDGDNAQEQLYGGSHESDDKYAGGIRLKIRQRSATANKIIRWKIFETMFIANIRNHICRRLRNIHNEI